VTKPRQAGVWLGEGSTPGARRDYVNRKMKMR